MTAEGTLTRFRDYSVGPARFMNLVSCFELGVIDQLRDHAGLTAAQLGEAVGVTPDAVEQLLHLFVKEGFVACDEASGGYRLDALAEVAEADLRRELTLLNMIKVVMLRQVFYLTESVRAGTVVGLKELYGFDGNLYGAVAEHRDLRESWATLMDNVTAHIDHWFFANIDVPSGAQVLDLAGNTGLGAMHTYRLKSSPGLRVTTFDLPEKENECLENFRANGMEEHCSFIGGDVFQSVPSGFSVVLIKHFLDMFDKKQVLAILNGANQALDEGGQVHVLVPVYPEDFRSSATVDVDFFPAFFLGCTMGQGGPQKLSTYRSWLEECGFKVTQAIYQDPADILPGTFVVHGLLSATKIALSGSRMNRPIRIGVHLWPGGGPDYLTWREAVVRAEELGADVILGYDHFHRPAVRRGPKGIELEPVQPDVNNFEGWTALASWGEITARAEIGLLVTGIGYRNPDLLADMARTVDHISGGRLILGLGAGYYQKDYTSYGYDYGTLRSRMDLFAEGIGRIERRLENLKPKPLRQIPLLIGGAGERRTLPLVGAHAHIWHCGLDLETFRRKNALVKQYAAAAGRSDSVIERATTWAGAPRADALLAEGVTLFIAEVKPGPAAYELTALSEVLAWRDSVR
jgi:probable F420-dependent oxidoreductase